MFPQYTWALIAVAAAICALGFYRFVWFMSVGYGLAVAGLGAAMLALGAAAKKADLCIAVLCVLALVYGVRLGGFLLVRELKNKAYKQVLDSQTSKPVPFPVKLCMWAFMAVLYTCQVSPVWYRINNTGRGDALAWIGAVIACAGIVIEGISDRQKSASKAKDPGKPAMDGLFKISRCPNYFGEMTFWTGIFVSGLSILKGGQWAVALIGYVCIIFIMVSGAKRLEKRQNRNYGSDPEYRRYADTTPILLPFIPVYHLVKDGEDKK